jgi:hypothetical protein
MLIKSTFLALVAASTVYGRFLIVERDGRAIFPRRFGQEQCNGLPGQIGQACQGDVCGVLGGKTISTLLAASPECAQQDLADEIIDASKSQDAATAANMVQLAIQFRQCEKNTPPDFTKNPPALRNSVFCQTAPANAELIGLVQAQDPANDPNLFFDPATKSTVTLGSQANTFALGSAQSVQGAVNVASPAVQVVANQDANVCNAAAVTVTVTAAASAETAAASIEIVNDNANNAVQQVAVNGALDFGSCTNPAVEFGGAFEGRKLSELTFEPQDKNEFAQGSAKNADIVFRAICNILGDKCQAGQATVDACQAAIQAASGLDGGAKADAFNAGLGIQSDFANVQAAPGGGPAVAGEANKADFNDCAAPQIAFGIFDGRKEDSFAPVGDDFDHGSALNPDIITKFVCDQLVNKCDANQQAIADCAAAQDATKGLSGQALADAFNARVTQNV